MPTKTLLPVLPYFYLYLTNLTLLIYHGLQKCDISVSISLNLGHSDAP